MVEFIFGFGMVGAFMGWGTLAVRIHNARQRKDGSNIQLGAHAAMTVVGVMLMLAAFCIEAVK